MTIGTGAAGASGTAMGARFTVGAHAPTAKVATHRIAGSSFRMGPHCASRRRMKPEERERPAWFVSRCGWSRSPKGVAAPRSRPRPPRAERALSRIGPESPGPICAEARPTCNRAVTGRPATLKTRHSVRPSSVARDERRTPTGSMVSALPSAGRAPPWPRTPTERSGSEKSSAASCTPPSRQSPAWGNSGEPEHMLAGQLRSRGLERRTCRARACAKVLAREPSDGS